MWLPLARPLLGIWPATQACAHWELNWLCFGLQASAQPTEPHQPGQDPIFYKSVLHILSGHGLHSHPCGLNCGQLRWPWTLVQSGCVNLPHETLPSWIKIHIHDFGLFLVSRGCCNEGSQAERLKEHKQMVAEFWRLAGRKPRHCFQGWFLQPCRQWAVREHLASVSLWRSSVLLRVVVSVFPHCLPSVCLSARISL